MKAFPWQERLNSDDPNVVNPVPHGGMDLRDYFAASALQGLLAYGGWNSKLNMDFPTQEYAEKGLAKDCISNVCYEYADAMMKAREQ